MLEVHHPNNERVMVRRRPSISCEVEMPWVVLEEFGYAFSALLVSCLDVVSNSVWRRDCEVGVSCREEVDKLRVRDDACRAITLCYPFRDVGTARHDEFEERYS